MKTKSIEKRTFQNENDPIRDIIDTPRPVVALSKDFPDGHTIPYHKHWRAQLLYASSGVMTVATETGIWVVPPFRGVWIPAKTNHQIYCSGHLTMRTLYFDPHRLKEMEQRCNVLAIPPLLRELILEITRFPLLYPLGGAEERLIQVLLDQIQALTVDPLELPVPQDIRLQNIYKNLIEDPADNKTIEDWARNTGMTSRTLSRLFHRETGMSFRQWKQQIKILEALRQLGQNESVTSVALNLGYDSPSAFIAMFRKALGKTPGQYFNIKSELLSN